MPATDAAAEAPGPDVDHAQTSRPLSVEVRNADVKYRIYADKSFSMRELVSSGFKNRESTIVHAVQDVSFDVRVGEAVGIVGSNGSGKSTLLRAIAGVQSLESGTIRVGGEAQLLGVGSALKRGLSGRRNVLLGGLAMGMSRAAVEAEMEHVIEFSGLGEAINRPMQTYSSGMQARLAFSIATLRVPDVLLIDEALAVGDKKFRAKSLERVEEIRSQASTVIMVTHQLSEIEKSCSRVIWLEHGVMRADGTVDEVLGMYQND